MKIKKIAVVFLLLTLTITLFGCEFLMPKREGIAGDVKYLVEEKACIVTGLTEIGEEKEIIYVLDEIDGRPVEFVGVTGFNGHKQARFHCANLKKIYFPWSITKTSDPIKWINGEDSLEYAISASTSTFIGPRSMRKLAVIPMLSYKKILEKKYAGFNWVGVSEEFVLPANISYLFNYEESPNENYFFVDLLEESGKLTKPPYDPRREGYTFVGWYTEPECVNSFDFEEDSVTINFDEEGNRIYEEFCLYAKWDKK